MSTHEVTDKVEMKGAQPAQNLAGDSLVNQKDSDSVRQASLSAGDGAKSLLDPLAGNAFKIEANAKSLREYGIDKPVKDIGPGDAFTMTSKDGLRRSIDSFTGVSTYLDFNKSGGLDRISVKNNDGTGTVTEFGADGGATRVRSIDKNGKRSEAPAPPGTGAVVTPRGDGTSNLAVSGADGSRGFNFDKDNRLISATERKGTDFKLRVFDDQGQLQETATVSVADGKRIETSTMKGINRTDITDLKTNVSESSVTSQFSPLGHVDSRFERTDITRRQADGSADVDTKFKVDKSHTYKTHIDANGHYQTDKVDDVSKARIPYKSGKQRTFI